MDILDNLGVNKVFFIGIGGVSMSSLAEILLLKGFGVAGSDLNDGPSVKRLAEAGAKVKIGHSADNITDDIGLVVYTAAIKDDNPEIVAARAKGLTVIDRATLLGSLMGCYPTSVGIAGTHGKTTTTSMIVDILFDYDPTALIGGEHRKIGGCYRAGASGLFIAEACEYCDSFLKFYPKAGVILNIEQDHLDYFEDIAHIRRSYRAYAENSRDILVINSNIEDISEITDGLTCKVITFGTSSSDYYAENISFDENGASSFEIYCGGVSLAKVKWGLTGLHNITNAVAAFAVCAGLYPHLPYDKTAAALCGFCPAVRRFQYKGEYNGAIIIDDYAHHPTEIKMALSGAKNMRHKKIICLFQPHTYTRTEALFDEFVSSFKDADEAAFVDIYAARERNPGNISSKLLSDAVLKTGKTAKYFGSLTDAADYYTKNLTAGDIFITMGAGDVYLAGDAILQAAEEGGNQCLK